MVKILGKLLKILGKLLKIKKKEDSRETLLFFGFGAFLVVKEEKYIKSPQAELSESRIDLSPYLYVMLNNLQLVINDKGNRIELNPLSLIIN